MFLLVLSLFFWQDPNSKKFYLDSLFINSSVLQIFTQFNIAKGQMVMSLETKIILDQSCNVLLKINQYSKSWPLLELEHWLLALVRNTGCLKGYYLLWEVTWIMKNRFKYEKINLFQELMPCMTNISVSTKLKAIKWLLETHFPTFEVLFFLTTSVIRFLNSGTSRFLVAVYTKITHNST